MPDREFALPEHYGQEFLRVEVGSTLHGTGLPGGEDLDMMGLFIERPESTVGLQRVEQWTKRSKADGVRSEPGDTDLVVYALRKWARLALNGNPSVLLVLFAPTDKVVLTSALGDGLRANADWFASKRAGKAFLGYMEQQRQRMLGQRGSAGRIRIQHTPDGKRIIDWKYAMHMLRLGVQGVEFLSTGVLTLPMSGGTGDYLRSVRRGERSIEDVLAAAERLEHHVKRLLDGESPLPDEPEHDAVERWIIKAHVREWLWDTANEQLWRSL